MHILLRYQLHSQFGITWCCLLLVVYFQFNQHIACGLSSANVWFECLLFLVYWVHSQLWRFCWAQWIPQGKDVSGLDIAIRHPGNIAINSTGCGLNFGLVLFDSRQQGRFSERFSLWFLEGYSLGSTEGSSLGFVKGLLTQALRWNITWILEKILTRVLGGIFTPVLRRIFNWDLGRTLTRVLEKIFTRICRGSSHLGCQMVHHSCTWKDSTLGPHTDLHSGLQKGFQSGFPKDFHSGPWKEFHSGSWKDFSLRYRKRLSLWRRLNRVLKKDFKSGSQEDF